MSTPEFKLDYFKDAPFFVALRQLFQKQLEVPIHFVTEAPLALEDVLGAHYKLDSTGHRSARETYFLGIVDDSAFAGAVNPRSLDNLKRYTRQYKGLAIFGIKLDPAHGSPKRAELTEIIRAINKAFLEMPVMVVFQYGDFLSLAAIERMTYKQASRDGDKLGKVYLLQDIDVMNPHAGHQRILLDLKIKRYGKGAIYSYDELYKYWQQVLNVSLLNERFYKELQTWFFWAVDNVEFPEGKEPNEDKRNAINVIRLITRIIFVWFLKERKLVPDNLFDKEELEDVLKWQDSTGSTYYKAILQNLFFATLNTEMDKDKKGSRTWVNRQAGVQEFYRYDRFFQDKDTALTLFKDIPFLNGGLFDNLDRFVGTPAEVRVDCFSNRLDNEKCLKFPDELFFNTEPAEIDLSKHLGIKKGGKQSLAKVRGLFAILNSYKFTIAENTPIDQEVALDPELLGRVFENLLAAYNPETKTTARNMTGSFYTPREIVDFMVDESLIAYLLHRLPAATFAHRPRLREDLSDLFSYGEKQPFGAEEERKAIIHCLNECKIIDPACGSGAFPMGILQKMVHVLSQLDPQNALWRAEQIARAKRELEADKRRAEEIQDEKASAQATDALNEKLRNIEDVFDPEGNELSFARKLFLIENCIFGVDIQPIATLIARLRVFISLLEHQKVQDERLNRGIIPLPNLETRFVAADSLIALTKLNDKTAQQRIRSRKVEEKEAELKEVRRRYFRARTKVTKEKYRARDAAIRDELKELLEANSWGADAAEKIANWDMFDQNTHADYFDSEWMYGIDAPEMGGGFDIVIGNPPYVQIQSFSGKPEQKRWEAMEYEIYSKTGDIYSLFYERGLRLLRAGGHLAYITSNKWMRTGYGEKTRAYFTKHTNPTVLIDFGMAQVFDSATTYTNILLLQRAANAKAVKVCRIDKTYSREQALGAYFEAHHATVDNYDEGTWIAYKPEEYKIVQQVIQQGVALKDASTWDIEINRGILTGLNDAFVLNKKDKDALCNADPKNIEIIKPMIRGRDVRRWYPNFEEQWLIGTFPVLRLNIDDYPVLRDFMQRDEMRAELEPKPKGHVGKWEGRKQGSYKWFETQDSIAYWREFEKPKIIYPNMTKYLPFSYDEDGFYTNQKCFIITGKRLKYLTAVLNSAVYYFCFKDRYPELLGETYELSKIFFDKIPIKVPSEEEETPLARMTEYLSYSYRNIKADQDAQLMAYFFERLADALVYELYFTEAFAQAGKTVRAAMGDLPPITHMTEEAVHFPALRAVWQRLSAPTHAVAYAIATMNEIRQVALIEEVSKQRAYVQDHGTED
jgi:adenine-specific DNA-methyltransferase